MRILLTSAFFLVWVPGAAQAQLGDPHVGNALWESPALFCGRCHGEAGEGGYGPDLAGRQLTFEQFKRALRTPWGVMPAFTEQQLSDEGIAQVLAYMSSLPVVAQPGPWRTPVPPNAPRGQVLLIATAGCGQCHGAELARPRVDAGAVGADFEWFKGLVYEHTTAMDAHSRLLGEEPDELLRMGNYSTERLPEFVLAEIWSYVTEELGLRVPIAARLSRPATAGGESTYTLAVENSGVVGKGLTAEELTVELTLPAGATAKTATGLGYDGVHQSRGGKNVAIWRLPLMAPQDRQTLTITLSGTGAAATISEGTVRWTGPPQGDGSGDSVLVSIPDGA